MKKIKKLIQKFKDKLGCWSGLDKAGSVFMARMAVLAGTIGGVIAAIDPAPLWALLTAGTEPSRMQLILMCIGIVGYAVTAEIVRTRGTKDF